jgi:hypothetical protein
VHLLWKIHNNKLQTRISACGSKQQRIIICSEMPTLPDIVLPDPNDKNLSQLLAKKGQYLTKSSLAPYLPHHTFIATVPVLFIFFTSQIGLQMNLHLKMRL